MKSPHKTRSVLPKTRAEFKRKKPVLSLTDAERIAKEHLFIDTLAQRNHDSLDFHDVSVLGVVAALNAAYRAGQDSLSK